MSVTILLVAATNSEADTLSRIPGIEPAPDGFRLEKCDIKMLITGVGSAATAWSLTKWISLNPVPDLAINAGIAGSYRKDIAVGDVVMPVSDCFADSGIDTPGGFLPLWEAGLQDPDGFPFRGGRIYSENKYVSGAVKKIRPVSAITLNTVSGSEKTIERIKKLYNPDIETMEGATFFYICSRGKIPFLALRSISNMVEPRDKSRWEIELALSRLSESLTEVLTGLD